MANLFRAGDVAGTSRAIALGHLRCVDAARVCLDRAAATEPVIQAFLHLDPAAALREAKERDRELAAGRRRSALHGIPVAVKDIIDVAGMPTTAASRVIAATAATEDAEIVAALREAGAVVIGKTNTHEFANGGTTPPTRNPLDPERISGGSSGGSAAAVAAGSALLGVGTDTGGSARLPAALCGIAGFRPRRRTGSVGMRGILPLAAEFDQWGLLAASANDLALTFDALSGTPPQPVFDLRGCRLCISDRLPQFLQNSEPSVIDIFSEAMRDLIGAGTQISTIGLPELASWRAPRMAIQMRQMLEVHRQRGWWPDARHLYTEEVRANLEIAERQVDTPLNELRNRLQELDAGVDAILAGGALIALPTVAVTAPKAEDVERMARGSDTRHSIIGLLGQAVLPFSRPELASITISCGYAANGLPVGLQLIGTDDASVLGAAAAIEAALAAKRELEATHA